MVDPIATNCYQSAHDVVTGHRTPSAPSDVGLRRTGPVAAFADQAASSLANFLVLLVAIRSLTVTEIGIFTVAYTTLLVIISVLRAATTEPLLIRFTIADKQERLQAASRATGALLAVGLVVAVIASITAWAIPTSFSPTIIAGSSVLPILLVQDAWRYYFFSAGQPWAAVANDGACLAVTAVVSAIFAARGWVTVPGVLAIWGIGTSAGLIIGVIQTGCLPALGNAWAWLREVRTIGPQLAAERSLEAIGAQVALMLIGSIGGLSTIGQVGAARAVMAPVTTVTTSIALFAVPEAVRRRDEIAGRLNRMVWLTTITIVLAVIVFTLFIAGAPSWLGAAIAGDSWETAKELLIPVAIWTAASGGRQGPGAGLKALQNGRAILCLSAATIPVLLAFVTVGTWWSAASGAAWAFAGVYGFSLAAWLIVYHRCQMGFYLASHASEVKEKYLLDPDSLPGGSSSGSKG